MLETGWNGLASRQGSWTSQGMGPRPVGPPEGTSNLDFSPPEPESKYVLFQATNICEDLFPQP